MWNGLDHRKIAIAVRVQPMVFSQVAGTLFTADRVTGNRKVASVERLFAVGTLLVRVFSWGHHRSLANYLLDIYLLRLQVIS